MWSAIQSLVGRYGKLEKPRPHLSVESLDDRMLPSAVLTGGTLSITGTNNHDAVVVSRQYFEGALWVRVNERTTGGTSDGRPLDSWFRAADVRRISFFGLDGNDVFTNETAIDCLARGGNGRDVLTGGSGRDVLYGDAGHDRLMGRGGNDILYGNAGNDVLQGGAGIDRLYGGEDDDKLFGGSSYDYLYGDAGNDFLDDGGGANFVDGGTGLDFNARVLAYRGATKEDVIQQQAPTCGCLAAIMSVAHTGRNLLSRISYLGVGDSGYNPVYRVRLFRDGAWRNVDIAFNGDLIRKTNPDGSPGAIIDALPRSDEPGLQGCEQESWVTILQRAYLQVKGVDWRDWRDVDANGTCDPGRVMKALTGLDSDQHRIGWINDRDKDRIMRALRYNKPVVVCTVDRERRLSTETLVTNHCYSVVGCYTRSDGKTIFRVRNPWGYDGGTDLNEDGVIRGEDSAPGDGVIELTWHDFKGSMQHYWING